MMNLLSWDKLHVKQKITLFSLSMLGIIYLFYSFLLVPEWARIDELETNYNLERQQLQIVESFVLAHPNPEEYLSELDQKIIKSNKMLPDTPDVSNFLLQAEQLATECGLQLNYLKPGKIDAKQGYSEISVEFSVNGNFAGIMNFLHKTESLSRFISITTISMQLSKNGLESKMVAKIFSYGVIAPTAANNSTENKK